MISSLGLIGFWLTPQTVQYSYCSCGNWIFFSVAIDGYVASSLNSARLKQLRERAHQVRRHVINVASKGGCFIGASLSYVDLLVYLYGAWLRVDAKNLREDAQRDYLLLSKGHDVPALYGVFAEMDILDPARPANHLKPRTTSTGTPTARCREWNFTRVPWAIYSTWAWGSVAGLA